MKLVGKLVLALVIGMCLVLGAYGYLRVRRERALFTADMQRDARMLGRAVGKSVADAWRRDGEARAFAVIREASQRRDGVTIRWIWLDAPPQDAFAPAVGAESLSALADGREVTPNDPGGKNEGLLITYVPVRVPPKRIGALELTESLEEQESYVRASARDTLVAMLALVGLSGLVAVAAGAWLVGRPIRALVGKARRTGSGDLSGPLDLPQNDELGLLAREMNLMCTRLGEARATLDGEISARIAALEQLRHADRLTTVGKLASGIAHELGTPLNVISGRAKLITRDTDDESLRQNALIIAQQADRMTNIIRQLLDFSRRRASHKSSTDLVALARRTLELLEPLAQKRGVTLRVAPATESMCADIDPGQIQQGLTNLVINAIQAMDRPGEIVVAIARRDVCPPHDVDAAPGEYFSISVRDEGQGISAQHIDHVFEPFYTTKDVGEGTGLGLSVSHGIAREHRGWIGVESEPSKGSTFTLYLPMSHEQASSDHR
jgi:two-component system, NtrC family, sensor kinase